MQRRRREKSQRRLRISLYGLAFLVILVDQVSKAAVLRYFSTSNVSSLPIINKILHFTFVRNPGIAFGLLQQEGSILTSAIFACVIVLLLVSLKLRTASSAYQWAFGLVMGGALSNFVDRLRLGYVFDFIDIRVWPVFNVADSCITVGILLLMLLTLKEH